MAPIQFTQVGNELPEASFGEIIRSVAQGIADGQRALDLAAVQTMIVLANTQVNVIPEVTEIITGEPISVPISGQPDVGITGVRVSGVPSDPVAMSALQAGLLPTFYQFTDVEIDLKMSIQIRQATQTNSDGSTTTGIFAFGSHVNFRNQNTYSYQVDSSSSVTATLKPVPVNLRITPQTIVINNLSGTPTITTSS